jgi:delta24(24(1))-sterol reductase
MIIHRALRDIERCRENYGEAWTEYEKMVPYLFIPVSSLIHTFAKMHMLTLRYSMFSKRTSKSWIDFSVAF